MPTTYKVMACAEQGHIRHGVGISTNPDETLWDDHCLRCGARLSPSEEKAE